MINKIWDKICGVGKWCKERIVKCLVVLGIIGIASAAGIADLNRNEISLEKVQQKYEQATEIKAKYQLEGSSLKRVDIKNPELTKNGEPKDKITVEIGNKDKAEFSPEIKISRWDEVNFKIIPKLEGIPTRDKDLTFIGDKIKFSTPKIDYEMYEYSEGEGGYKFIWTLKEKPKSNIVEFGIETSGLDFFYQPPLTQEFQNGYSEEFGKEIVVTETQVKDLEGNILVERPEKVVGSYAVFHQTKGVINDINGKDYKTGKAFHIYRPKLIDDNGWEVWGNLNIDTEKGIYSVEIPEDFYNNAVYPIKSNDEFGYHPVTPESTYQLANYLYTYAFACPAAGTVTQISFYETSISDVTANQSFVAYDASNRTDYSPELNEDWDPGWRTQNVQVGATLSAQTYYLGFFCQGAGYVAFYFDTDAGATNWYESVAYTYPPPATWTKSQSAQTRKFAIYVTYTPSGEEEEEEPEMQVDIISKK